MSDNELEAFEVDIGALELEHEDGSSKGYVVASCAALLARALIVAARHIGERIDAAAERIGGEK